MLRLLLALALATPAVATPLADIAAGKTAASPEMAGLVAVVADRKGVVFSEAVGRAEITPLRPLTVDTPMRVASISKLVVAIAVMRLVEEGRLDLDADVSKYLGWKLRNPAYPDKAVTLRQLLSHTSGIEDGPGYRFPLGEGLQQGITPAHWAKAAPGMRFSYANLNYGIIASVMEVVTGERFDLLMTRLVLAPLKLDAGYNWSGASDRAVADAAVLYRKGKDETAWDPAGPWVPQVDDLHGVRPACPVANGLTECDLGSYRPGRNGTLFSPQGGLRISALGLAKIGRLLLNQGAVDGVRLLSPASVRLLMSPVWQAGQGETGENYDGAMLCYGPGLQCLSGTPGATDQPVPGAKWWGHLGEAYGLLGGLWVDPPGGRVIVYLITGTGDDPKKAPHTSSFTGPEEAVLQALSAVKVRR
jgi:CubicO group peptidase (beta-lactamase class C family)